jgi:hypothetical protein
MKSVYKYSTYAVLMVFCISVSASSQSITWGGNIDFEYRNGGRNSNPLLNQTPNANPVLFVPNARFFATVELDSEWWIDATIQTDYYGQAEPHPVFFSLANLNFQPWENRDLKFQAGRIIIPFGLDHKRFINPENPFANLGIDGNWNLRVDKKHGYIPTGAFNYTTGKPGQSVVYQRRYTQGASVSGSLGKDQLLDYTLALTMAPASGHAEAGMHNAPSFIGRAVLKPVVWLALGASATRGSYMHRMPGVNDSLSQKELSSFKQTAWAADVTVDYAWYRFSAQYTRSTWNAPWFQPPGSVPVGEKSWVERDLKTNIFQLEARVNLPMLPGTYVAARHEWMTFNEVSQTPYTVPVTLSGKASFAPDEAPFMPEWKRWEVVAGRKLSRTVTAKLSWQNGFNSGLDERDDKLFVFQLTTLF